MHVAADLATAADRACVRSTPAAARDTWTKVQLDTPAALDTVPPG
jgi:hypothetical protein